MEGDKDEAALRALGVEGPIVKTNVGENLFAFVEGLAQRHRSAILLVDWDARGGRLAKRLREACRANGVALDDAHRLALAKATRGEVKTVESLDTYAARLPARAPERSDPARVRRLLDEARERAERAKDERRPRRE